MYLFKKENVIYFFNLNFDKLNINNIKPHVMKNMTDKPFRPIIFGDPVRKSSILLLSTYVYKVKNNSI